MEGSTISSTSITDEPAAHVAGRPLTERDLRNALIKLLANSGSRARPAIAEFWLPGSNARADLVVMDHELSAFEIKGGLDNLTRLPAQALAYSQIFTRCTLVAHRRHVDPACAVIPSWWGVIEANDHGNLTVLREPSTNPGPDVTTVVQLLWKEEVWNLLRFLECDVAQSEPRSVLWVRLLDHVNGNSLHGLVASVLASRDWSARRYSRLNAYTV